jgi:hypothetical protein
MQTMTDQERRGTRHGEPHYSDDIAQFDKTLTEGHVLSDLITIRLLTDAVDFCGFPLFPSDTKEEITLFLELTHEAKEDHIRRANIKPFSRMIIDRLRDGSSLLEIAIDTANASSDLNVRPALLSATRDAMLAVASEVVEDVWGPAPGCSTDIGRTA